VEDDGHSQKKRTIYLVRSFSIGTVALGFRLEVRSTGAAWRGSAPGSSAPFPFLSRALAELGTHALFVDEVDYFLKRDRLYGIASVVLYAVRHRREAY